MRVLSRPVPEGLISLLMKAGVLRLCPSSCSREIHPSRLVRRRQALSYVEPDFTVGLEAAMGLYPVLSDRLFGTDRGPGGVFNRIHVRHRSTVETAETMTLPGKVFRGSIEVIMNCKPSTACASHVGLSLLSIVVTLKSPCGLCWFASGFGTKQEHCHELDFS